MRLSWLVVFLSGLVLSMLLGPEDLFEPTHHDLPFRGVRAVLSRLRALVLDVAFDSMASLERYYHTKVSGKEVCPSKMGEHDRLFLIRTRSTNYFALVSRALFRRGYARVVDCPGDPVRAADINKAKFSVIWDQASSPCEWCDAAPNSWKSGVHGEQELVHKDRLARILSKTPAGRDISPYTYYLGNGDEYKAFLSHLENSTADSPQYWIVKPTDKAGGEGVNVVDSLKRFSSMYLSNRDPKSLTALNGHIAQRYIANPLLFDGRKFHFRVHLLIVVDGDKHWAFFHSGYIKTNPKLYDPSNITDRDSHISVEYHSSEDNPFVLLHSGRWRYSELDAYLYEKGIVNSQRYVEEILEPKMKEQVTLALKSAEFSTKKREFTYISIDFLLDDQLKLWLIEFTKPGASHPKNRKFPYFYSMFDEVFTILENLQMTNKPPALREWQQIDWD